MELPIIATGVPLVLHSTQRQTLTAQLVRMLIDAGVVHRRDLVAGDDAPLQVATRALNRWLDQAVGGKLHSLGCAFRLNVCEIDGALHCLQIAWSADWIGSMYLGTPLDALEAAVPGLGATVLDAIGSQAVHPMFTPVDAFEHTRFREWGGRRSEVQMLKEHYPDPKERKDALKDCITRKMFDEAIPAWALRSLERRKLGQARLRTEARREGWTGAVAAALLQVQAAVARAGEARATIAGLLLAEDGELYGEDSEFTGFAPCFSWDAADTVSQKVFDNMVEVAWQGTSHDHIGFAQIEVCQPGELRRFLRAMRAHCRAVRALDRLMTLLHERQ